MTYKPCREPLTTPFAHHKNASSRYYCGAAASWWCTATAGPRCAEHRHQGRCCVEPAEKQP